MNSIKLRVRKSKLDDVRGALSEEFGDACTLSVAPQPQGLAARKPLGQFDIVEIVVAAATSIALQELVNYLKMRFGTDLKIEVLKSKDSGREEKDAESAKDDGT